jgi:hypothetical protein
MPAKVLVLAGSFEAFEQIGSRLAVGLPALRNVRRGVSKKNLDRIRLIVWDQ